MCMLFTLCIFRLSVLAFCLLMHFYPPSLSHYSWPPLTGYLLLRFSTPHITSLTPHLVLHSSSLTIPPSIVLHLQPLLSPLPLPLPLLINPNRKRILPPPRNRIGRCDQCCQHHTSWLACPQRRSQKAQCRTMVHRRVSDVERECSDGRVHEDAEVVAEIGAGDAEGVHGG